MNDFCLLLGDFSIPLPMGHPIRVSPSLQTWHVARRSLNQGNLNQLLPAHAAVEVGARLIPPLGSSPLWKYEAFHPRRASEREGGSDRSLGDQARIVFPYPLGTWIAVTFFSLVWLNSCQIPLGCRRVSLSTLFRRWLPRTLFAPMLDLLPSIGSQDQSRSYFFGIKWQLDRKQTR